MLGSRHVQRMLVGSGACVGDAVLYVAEGDQHHLDLHLGFQAVPDGCQVPKVEGGSVSGGMEGSP